MFFGPEAEFFFHTKQKSVNFLQALPNFLLKTAGSHYLFFAPFRSKYFFLTES